MRYVTLYTHPNFERIMQQEDASIEWRVAMYIFCILVKLGMPTESIVRA